IITDEFRLKENKFLAILKSKKLEFEIISNNDFLKNSSTKNPQGIAAVFEIPKKNRLNLHEGKIVCLENISDPGNLGTILRSCNWFGIKTVLLSKNCAELYNPKVLRASMGAIFHLNIHENINLINEISALKKMGYESYYADMNGADYRKINFNEKCIITFCNEASGPTKDLKSISDYAITIPSKGNIDSLNVSAAAAVILSRL
ncbi:MAG: RNA methyltransferase, partial [Ignavibacteriae bacterium]|nr:RNA methyltransferase [Ignavibacteriota bacterium]